MCGNHHLRQISYGEDDHLGGYRTLLRNHPCHRFRQSEQAQTILASMQKAFMKISFLAMTTIKLCQKNKHWSKLYIVFLSKDFFYMRRTNFIILLELIM